MMQVKCVKVPGQHGMMQIRCVFEHTGGITCWRYDMSRHWGGII
jgi:hypothetical protein